MPTHPKPKTTQEMVEYLATKSQFDILAPDERWTPDLANARSELFETGDERTDQPPLVKKLREKVYTWRQNNYAGVSATTKSLLTHWFSCEHIRYKPNGETYSFQWYFGQREAVETAIYILEVAGIREATDLKIFSDTELRDSQLPDQWLRLVFKLATGGGKTKVMSLLMVWCYFHKKYEDNSPLSCNFLLIAPNVIVAERLKADFENNQIFKTDPLIPECGYSDRDWDFQLTTHIGSDIKLFNTDGNIYLTNIQKIYTKADDIIARAEDLFLGNTPAKKTTDSMLKIRDIIRNLYDLVIINDEAHHIWDDKLAWNNTLKDIHLSMQSFGSRVALQLDLTATPKDPKGNVFVQTVSNFPLVEAIALDILKRPFVPDETSQSKLKADENKTRVSEKYEDCIKLGIQEYKKQYEFHTRNNKKPILFIMVPVVSDCTSVVDYLERDEFFKGKVFEIHTNAKGETADPKDKAKKQELEAMRKVANSMDTNQYLVIVSVLMLKEGWDVSNVTTVIGLRAYTSKGEILPEQALGRGLRKMVKGIRSREELFVVGSPAFMEFINKVRYEGVNLGQRAYALGNTDPNLVEVKSKEPEMLVDMDIEFPILNPRLEKKTKTNWSELVIAKRFMTLKQYSQEELKDFVVIDIIDNKANRLIEFDPNKVPDSSLLIRSFVIEIMSKSGLSGTVDYDILYGMLKKYLENDLFNQPVNLFDWSVLKNLNEPNTRVIVVGLFADQIKKLPIIEQEITAIERWIKMSQCPTFDSVAKNFVMPTKSISLKLVGDSGFELDFAMTLDKLPDVVSFAKNYQAKSSRNFEPLRLEYIDLQGFLRTYYPDFLVKTTGNNSKLIYIVETKGQQNADDILKFQRLKLWCQDVNKVQSKYTFKCLYILQTKYESGYQFSNFEELCRIFATN